MKTTEDRTTYGTTPPRQGSVEATLQAIANINDDPIIHKMIEHCLSELKADEPVAWLHIMDNTEGVEGAEPQRMLTFTQDRPFGISGVEYSERFSVTSTPLYSKQNTELKSTKERSV